MCQHALQLGGLKELLRLEAEDFESLVTCNKAALNSEALVRNVLSALIADALDLDLESILFFVKVFANLVNALFTTDRANPVLLIYFSTFFVVVDRGHRLVSRIT